MVKTLYRWCKRLLLLAWVISLILIGALVTHKNAQLVDFVLFWRFEQIPVGGLVITVFVLGVLLGFFVAAPVLIWNGRRIKRLKHKNTQLEHKASGIVLGPP